MKKSVRFAIAATAVAALVLVATPANAASTHASGATAPRGTIVDVAVAASGGGTPDKNPWDYDILVQALVATGLHAALADTSTKYTVFAPNDRAFIRLVTDLTGKAPASEAAALATITSAFTKAQIANILLHHVVAGKKLGPIQGAAVEVADHGERRHRQAAGYHAARRDPGARRPAPGAVEDQHPGIQRRHPHDRPRSRSGSLIEQGSRPILAESPVARVGLPVSRR